MQQPEAGHTPTAHAYSFKGTAWRRPLYGASAEEAGTKASTAPIAEVQMAKHPASKRRFGVRSSLGEGEGTVADNAAFLHLARRPAFAAHTHCAVTQCSGLHKHASIVPSQTPSTTYPTPVFLFKHQHLVNVCTSSCRTVLLSCTTAYCSLDPTGPSNCLHTRQRPCRFSITAHNAKHRASHPLPCRHLNPRREPSRPTLLTIYTVYNCKMLQVQLCCPLSPCSLRPCCA